jgi:hypothetical protein
MRFAIALLVAVMPFFGGCASPNAYVAPAGGDSAHLTGKWLRTGLYEWESFGVRAVDDRFVANPLIGRFSGARVALAPGGRRILVEAEFNRTAAGSGPFQAFIALRHDFRANADYKLNGAIKGNLVEVWIEDEPSGRKVSETFSADFRTKRGEGITIPVVVPGSAVRPRP